MTTTEQNKKLLQDIAELKMLLKIQTKKLATSEIHRYSASIRLKEFVQKNCTCCRRRNGEVVE
jgi:hypothetical protein